MGFEQQPADQRALAVVDRAAEQEPQKAPLLVRLQVRPNVRGLSVLDGERSELRLGAQK
jgi:hypothetical protein